MAGNVRLEYSADSGLSWTTILPSTPNDGNEAWTLPGSPSTRAQVRISAVDGSAVDTSDHDFEVAYVGGVLKAPARDSFGSVRIGTARTRTVVVFNRSKTEPLQINLDVGAAPFALQIPSAAVIPPRGRLIVPVRCEPKAPGKALVALSIRSSDPRRPTWATTLKVVAR